MKLLKILLTVIFLLSLTCVQPLPTHAFNCNGNNSGIRSHDDTLVGIDVKLGGTFDDTLISGYVLYYDGQKLATSISVDTDDQIVIFYVDKTQLETALAGVTSDKITFDIDHPNADDCDFKIKLEDIEAALGGDGNGNGNGNGNGGPIISTCTGSYGDGAITGLGCIPTSPEDLAKWLLSNALVMGGGIAVLLSFFGGISIILAGGDPEKINQGKQIITSALSGLLFIVFSIFLLRFIGVDILQLPGFEK